MVINDILTGNCMEIMPTMPENGVDLTVTSCPYGKVRDYNGAVNAFNFPVIAEQLYRVTKNGGMLAWNEADQRDDFSLSGLSFEHCIVFKKLGFKLLDVIFYVKNGLFNQYPNTLCQTVEYVFIFVKGDRPIVGDTNILRDRKNKHAYTIYHGTRRQSNGETKPRKKQVETEYSKRTQIWEYNVGGGHMDTLVPLIYDKGSKKVEHPAIMHDQLAADLIKCYSNSGDLVFDPMCGSGTTLAVAALLGRHWLGIEIRPEWAEKTRQRVEIAHLIQYKNNYINQQKITAWCK